jgi:hypothetical protein
MTPFAFPPAMLAGLVLLALPACAATPPDASVVAAPSIDLSRIKPGWRVNFSIQKGKGGMYEVQSVQPAGAVQ